MQEVSELKETEQRKILILEMDFAQNGGGIVEPRCCARGCDSIVKKATRTIAHSGSLRSQGA